MSDIDRKTNTNNQSMELDPGLLEILNGLETSGYFDQLGFTKDEVIKRIRTDIEEKRSGQQNPQKEDIT